MAKAPKRAEPKLTDFVGWRKRFERIYREACKRPPSPYPRRRPLNELKVEFYRYYRAIKKAGELQALEDHIQQRDGQYWSRHRGKGKGSWWVLRLPEADDGDFQIQSSTTRSRLATELEYADQNNIAPDMLLAFLYESGATDTIEEDFADGERPKWAARYRE